MTEPYCGTLQRGFGIFDSRGLVRVLTCYSLSDRSAEKSVLAQVLQKTRGRCVWHWQRSILLTAERLGTVGARRLVRGRLQAQISAAVLQITPATTCGSSFRRIARDLE